MIEEEIKFPIKTGEEIKVLIKALEDFKGSTQQTFDWGKALSDKLEVILGVQKAIEDRLGNIEAMLNERVSHNQVGTADDAQPLGKQLPIPPPKFSGPQQDAPRGSSDFREKIPKCRYCGVEIKWPKPYVQGQGPLNLDGTPHDCRRT